MAQAQAGLRLPVAHILLSEFHLREPIAYGGMVNKCRFYQGNVTHIVPGDKATYPAAGQSLTPKAKRRLLRGPVPCLF
jgi:hypothetical protein